MSPIPASIEAFGLEKRRVGRPTEPESLVVEAWAQGYMVGSLIIMTCITMANLRKGVTLHKLLLGIWHGFWMFFDSPIYEWWLSVSAIFLNISWSLHNVIAWMKIRPFLPRPVSLIFIVTVIMVQPYWVLEIYSNFAYFHNINTIFLKTRPFEALCRDPWWIYTTVSLFYNIKVRYEMKLFDIIKISPRFGIMLGAMLLSLVFIVLDICAVTGALRSALPVGLNPFWKLSFVFKCLTDSVILDDFKTALDRLRAFKISRLGSFSQDNSDRRSRNNGSLVNTWEELAREAQQRRGFPSPDGDIDVGPRHHFPGFTSRPESKTKRKEHKDSVVAPNDPKRNSSSSSFGPEDTVPSALDGTPIKRMESVYVPDERCDNRRRPSAQQIEERDYYYALREMSDQSQPVSPPGHQGFPRRNSRAP
ncbi:hypothetical protein GQ43DRAFT_374914 [Delitschia confertaspora ATCC 74209]|uniref:Uncharacterized protein n=1 Tax=Delitschia confertaspora ATCC 74209 TaxID=1513339 RepID=A0A9P4MR29_9PLEO|nr:hypothetical protein GQ43DRAFT_374914 [Delitschia confertaspora ATCC 74209]